MKVSGLGWDHSRNIYILKSLPVARWRGSFLIQMISGEVNTKSPWCHSSRISYPTEWIKMIIIIIKKCGALRHTPVCHGGQFHSLRTEPFSCTLLCRRITDVTPSAILWASTDVRADKRTTPGGSGRRCLNTLYIFEECASHHMS